MVELLDVLDAFSTPLRMAWVVWLAWGVAQIFWYRYERNSRAAAAVPATPVRKPFVSKPSLPARVPMRIATPEDVALEPPANLPRVEPLALGEPPVEMGELDRFVADFEMHSRQRRADAHNGEAAFETHPNRLT
jgi:hypothetical protein